MQDYKSVAPPRRVAASVFYLAHPVLVNNGSLWWFTADPPEELTSPALPVPGPNVHYVSADDTPQPRGV